MLEEKKIPKKGIQKFCNSHTKHLISRTLTCIVISALLLSTTMVLALNSQKPAMAQPRLTPAPAPSGAPGQAPAGQAPQIPQKAPQLQQIPQLSPESVQSLKSAPQLLERSVANLPNIQPNTEPAGKPIPGKFVVALKAPTTAPATPAGAQQALSAMEQQAETLTSQIESAAPGVNVTDLGEIGVLLVEAEGAPQGTSPQGTSPQGLSSQGAAPPAASNVTTPELQQTVQRLEANPNVQDVVQDITVNINQQILPSAENRKDADWSPRPGRSGDGIDTVNADIAILDTGVQTNHPDLNVFRCVGFGYPNCNDGHGHGTHVAGIAAARDNNIGVVGAAPGARIWAVKVLSDGGSGSFSDILAGIAYVFANRAQIEAVNLSLGATGTFLPVENALRILALNGVTVAVSAGNNGPNANANGNTPARAGLGFNGVITVSAYGDSDGRCGGYGPATTRGPDDSVPGFTAFNVDIAAMGVDVLSTYKNSGYARMSGTSMSSPNVAGAAAFYKSLFPTMTPAQIEVALKTAGTKPGTIANGLFPCDGHGRGYVRLAANHNEPLLYMGLTGVYNANDGGRYYMRQNGPTTLYWAGLSGGGAGTAFTNVFRGTEQGIPSTTIAGQWCDVPRGTILNCGSLSIRLTGITTFARIADGGYLGSFGGSQWTKLP